MISVRQALDLALKTLGAQCPDSRMEVEFLLCHSLNKNRAYLFTHPERLLSDIEFNNYQLLVAKRARGIPIAYITGNREFWSLSLKVNPHTLIPRHETERLIELALELIPNEPYINILDLGTGSGAIALALAKERPNWHIDACDYSEEALLVAKENAHLNKIDNVCFYYSDWFNNLPEKRYNAIISNPPYIAPNDPHLQQGDVRFEPITALTSGQDGLADLQYIIKKSYDYLVPNGLLLLEHGYEQKLAVCTILGELAYKNIHSWQDIQGHDRVSGGWTA